jgi:hypothetical protein
MSTQYIYIWMDSIEEVSTLIIKSKIFFVVVHQVVFIKFKINGFYSFCLEQPN